MILLLSYRARNRDKYLHSVPYLQATQVTPHLLDHKSCPYHVSAKQAHYPAQQVLCEELGETLRKYQRPQWATTEKDKQSIKHHSL